MGRRRSAIPLSIFLNGRLVEVWAREASGATRFAYDPSWLDWENTLPISLSLPLRSDRYVGTPAITVFDNLLPDNEILRRRVAERVGAVGTDTHSLLSMIGRDCIGALQFIPEGEEPKPYDPLNGEPLNEEQVAALLKNLDVTSLGIRRENDLRISVAGTQGKTALLYHKGHWIAPSGTTPTTHIIKSQIGRLPNAMNLTESVENEFFV